MIGNKKLVKGSLPPTQERQTLPFLTPHPYPTFKNMRGAGRGEAACSSPIWSMEGSGPSWVVHIPHSWLQVGSSLLTAPHCNPKPQAAHSRGLLGPSPTPFTGGATVVKWRLSLQLLEELLRPHLARG